MDGDAEDSEPAGEYLHYLKAREILRDRLGATLEEIAFWTWLGAEIGGIDGYLDPHNFRVKCASRSTGEPRPPKFHFVDDGSDLDYRSQLMQCYFRRDDIGAFCPTDRLLTYTEVLKRWQGRLTDSEARALVASKARIGALTSFHPVTGGTRGTKLWGEEEGFPELDEGIFPVVEIALIEAECFPRETSDPPAQVAVPSVRERALSAAKVKSERQFDRLAPLYRELKLTPNDSAFAIMHRLIKSDEVDDSAPEHYLVKSTNATLSKKSIESWFSRAKNRLPQ